MTTSTHRPARAASIALLLASAFTLAACGGSSDGNDPNRSGATDIDVTTTPAGTTATANGVTTTDTTADAAITPSTYVTNPASGDKYEIESSRLALQHSRDVGLRAFAQQMITDHEATTAQLTTIAGSAQLPVPTEMIPRHAQQIEALRSASQSNDGSFDRLYRQQQIAAHTEAANLHRAMSTRSDAQDGLSSFARETLPKVESHRTMLAGMPETAPAAS